MMNTFTDKHTHNASQKQLNILFQILYLHGKFIW